MKRTWTIIGVRDVASSFKWYQSLFGQPATRPAHTYFGQIVDTDGTVLLCLHQWGDHDQFDCHGGGKYHHHNYRVPVAATTDNSSAAHRSFLRHDHQRSLDHL